MIEQILREHGAYTEALHRAIVSAINEWARESKDLAFLESDDPYYVKSVVSRLVAKL